MYFTLYCVSGLFCWRAFAWRCSNWFDSISDTEKKTVDDELVKLLDHKNLNADVAEFGKTNPTVENIVVFAWDKLSGKFGKAQLTCVTVWETDKTCCSYCG